MVQMPGSNHGHMLRSSWSLSVRHESLASEDTDAKIEESA